MRTITGWSILLAGLPLLATLLLVTSIQETSAQLCPLCQCPPVFEPVCAKRTDADGKTKVRGFPSLCEMECNNKCRKVQYSFLRKGRCNGKPKPAQGNKRQKENETTDKPVSARRR